MPITKCHLSQSADIGDVVVSWRAFGLVLAHGFGVHHSSPSVGISGPLSAVIRTVDLRTLFLKGEHRNVNDHTYTSSTKKFVSGPSAEAVGSCLSSQC